MKSSKMSKGKNASKKVGNHWFTQTAQTGRKTAKAVT